MREIKFRSFDKREGYMRPDVGKDNGGIMEDNLIYCLACPERFEVMQYTGLKDKNGKEIYEGDIVKFDSYADGIDEEGLIEEVKFEHGGFSPMTEPYGSGSGVLYSLWYDNFEVIGNMYENKELIKD